VIGSKQLAKEGQLVVVAAGDRTLYDDCQSCLQAMARHMFYLGQLVYVGTPGGIVAHKNVEHNLLDLFQKRLASLITVKGGYVEHCDRRVVNMIKANHLQNCRIAPSV